MAAKIAACGSVQRDTTNGKIVFQSDRDGRLDLYIMNSDNSIQKKLIDDSSSVLGPYTNSDPVPSPDGRSIAFQSNRDGNNEIYVINIENGLEINLTNNLSNDYSPTWSPDGQQIAFVSDRDSIVLDVARDIWTNNIYIVDADGSNVRRLTNDNVTNAYNELAWSPNGTQLALSLSHLSSFGGFFPNGINLMAMSDSGLTRLTFDQATNQGSPKWSSDGKHIIYVVSGSMLSNIYMMDADGTNQIALTNNSYPSIDPAWSPNGKYIIFASRKDGNYNIYSMNADGTNTIQLTDDSADESSPDWYTVR